jgi:hypothetical protein
LSANREPGSIITMRWLLLATLLLGGCGRADLQIELLTLDGDDPFASLTELSVVVRQGGEVIHELRQPFDTAAITLGPLDRVGGTSLTLVGYDEDGLVIARGEADPELPERGTTCCVGVCFCSVVWFDAGACTCGTTTCRDC